MDWDDFLDLWRSAKREGRLESPTNTSFGDKSPCGDRIGFDFIVEGGTIRDGSYHGVCCILCKGTAATLTDQAIGKTVEEAVGLEFKPDFEITTARHHCVNLAVNTFREAFDAPTQNHAHKGAGSDHSGSCHPIAKAA